jgi:hypothetical protein
MIYQTARQILWSRLLLPVIGVILPCTTFSQQPVVQTFTDKNNILIGEYIEYKVKAIFPSGIYKANWFAMPDSIAHFELVSRGKIDTTTENSNTVLQQTITLTSFDSGKWNTPAFVIGFNTLKDKTALKILTDSIAVNVGYAPADSTNQLRDIKPIIEVTVKDYLWYYIGAGIILLLLILLLLRRYLKNRKKTPAFQSMGKLSPYDEAMQELEKLKKLDLQDAGELKQFHSKLASIFKWYISRKQRVSILNKTTGDVLVQLTNNNLSKDIISEAATALRCGDAVKFAKYMPGTGESNDCAARIKNTINFMQQKNTINK